jgi:hypothetical protein
LGACEREFTASYFVDRIKVEPAQRQNVGGADHSMHGSADAVIHSIKRNFML